MRILMRCKGGIPVRIRNLVTLVVSIAAGILVADRIRRRGKRVQKEIEV